MNLQRMQSIISGKKNKKGDMAESVNMEAIQQAPVRDTVTMNYAHPNEMTARAESLRRASMELNKKSGKDVKYKILSQKMFKTKDGKYEGETILTQEED
jgi:hypothetical protein